MRNKRAPACCEGRPAVPSRRRIPGCLWLSVGMCLVLAATLPPADSWVVVHGSRRHSRAYLRRVDLAERINPREDCPR